MIFNSLEFGIFLPIVFFLYWLVFQKNTKAQNGLLLAASYLFYGWWDWRFLSLIIFSTVLDYYIGLGMHAAGQNRKRKLLLWTSLLVNLGFLGVFKYYNFFIDNFISAFRFFGNEVRPNTLDIILPVGISFYTFQTLSYSIDIYRKQLVPEKDFAAFAAFVSFFPQLVAGPIERATNLLPQFPKRRRFEVHQMTDGLRQILWGLFKKVVIADNCAEIANMVFNDHTAYSGPMLIVGALCFTFQIYGDFSGYSDIAIGTARLFGFNLKRNFAYPYFSRDMAEFWRRWHISLSTWFRDYLYIPLGGSRGGTAMKVRNTFIIFLVSGFWHGANWTFIVWGALNALYFMPLLLAKKNRLHVDIVAQGRLWPTRREMVSMAITFWLAVLAWIFFRATNVSQAMDYLLGIADITSWHRPDLSMKIMAKLAILGLLLGFFMLVEWLGREREYAIEGIGLTVDNTYYRWSFYLLLWTMVFVYSGGEQEFIYFQF